jgi:oligopeptide transport system substrate-binding protein
MRSAWIADVADPESFLDLWESGGANNETGWADPRYDALLERSRLADDPSTRLELLREAERLLLDASPVIPIYHYTHVFLIRPSVHGWYPTPLDHHPYKDVWLEPAPH